MNVKEFDYELPEELIAQTPLRERSESRLMVLDKDKQAIDHDRFYNIVDYLEAGDCLVLNNTKVLPARLIGAREHTGGKVEVLLLNQVEGDQWEVLVKPGKKARPGQRIVFGDGRLVATVDEVVQEGNRLVSLTYDGIFQEILDQLGTMPLPPYIKEQLEDQDRYQTVYSKHQGSAAAPTAGLHFTHDLLNQIKAKGVHLAYVTLHVGLGTFRPVKVDNIEDHTMHAEYCWIEPDQAALIQEAKASGQRVVAVGTTSLRTLESLTDDHGQLVPDKRWTDIFIYPGYQFKMIDALITNFHLPQSTLIMLVSALAGKDFVLQAYQKAVEEKYRFFSFGDAMFIK